MRPIRFGVHLWHTGPVQKIVGLAQLAEELGYDSLWLTDSQLTMPELYTKLTACALNTRLIILAPGVTNIRTRHPTVTASALATLADLAPGRVAAAISLGGSSHHSLGWRPDRLADFRRDFELIARLLQGERVSFDGRAISLVWADAEITRQVRLHVHAGFGPRIRRLAGEMGYPILLSAGLQELPRALGQLTEGATASGKRGLDVDVSWYVALSLSDDWEAVKEHVLPVVALGIRGRYLSYLQGSLPTERLGTDLEVARRVAEEYDFAEHASTKPRHAQLLLDQPDQTWREWAKGMLVGTSEEVLARLRQALQQEAIAEVVLSPHLSTPRLPVEEIMQRFAKEVRPLVSGA